MSLEDCDSLTRAGSCDAQEAERKNVELRFELLKRHDNGSDSNGNEDDRDHNDIVIISSAAITAN